MTILVDTMVIIEAYRIEAWNALSARYKIERVEKCVEETQTGMHNRPRRLWIDESKPRERLNAVHPVTEEEVASTISPDQITGFIDDGELHLWAHAVERTDAWTPCGPDAASLRPGVLLGFRERFVALETLIDDIGHRARIRPCRNHTKKWHDRTLAKIVIQEGL